jgi:hypothetical protein
MIDGLLSDLCALISSPWAHLYCMHACIQFSAQLKNACNQSDRKREVRNVSALSQCCVSQLFFSALLLCSSHLSPYVSRALRCVSLRSNTYVCFFLFCALSLTIFLCSFSTTHCLFFLCVLSSPLSIRLASVTLRSNTRVCPLSHYITAERLVFFYCGEHPLRLFSPPPLSLFSLYVSQALRCVSWHCCICVFCARSL